ncbi:hypothetical protein B0H13DRAFT_2052124, partial [Mycena leptocephala]
MIVRLSSVPVSGCSFVVIEALLDFLVLPLRHFNLFIAPTSFFSHLYVFFFFGRGAL